MNLASLLSKAATHHPTSPAICIGTAMARDYAGLARRAAALAASMRDRLRLQPGERVGIAMRNGSGFLETLFGIWHGGLCAVPMNARLHSREFEYLLGHSGARACFVSSDLAEAIAPLVDRLEGLDAVVTVDGGDYEAMATEDPAAMATVRAEDPAWLFYTSGTTGRPKGATLTHRNLLAATLSNFADIGEINSSGTIIHAAPMSHGSGILSLAFVARGARHVIPDSPSYDPAEMCRLLERFDDVSMFLAPTMINRLVACPELGDVARGRIRTIVYGGAPMLRADVERALESIGPKLVQNYSQGETPFTLSILSKADHADRGHPRWAHRIASAGRARLAVEMAIMGPDDVVLAPGEVGEVVTRSDVVMAGYWGDPDATEQTLRGGWLHTGDIGEVDADGYLTIKDRSKDMIISGGSNVYPREVEDVLAAHPDVEEVAVVGRPHPDWGEEVVAFVVTRGSATLPTDALDALCLENLSRYKRPRDYELVDALPKNNYGKILKRELREWLTASAARSQA